MKIVRAHTRAAEADWLETLFVACDSGLPEGVNLEWLVDRIESDAQAGPCRFDVAKEARNRMATTRSLREVTGTPDTGYPIRIRPEDRFHRPRISRARKPVPTE